MQEIAPASALAQEDIFVLFAKQLQKDFEGAGLGLASPHLIPRNFDALKQYLLPYLRQPVHQVNALLYRIDISETQLKQYGNKYPQLPYEELLAELIVKRVLQKVILKRNFS